MSSREEIAKGRPRLDVHNRETRDRTAETVDALGVTTSDSPVSEDGKQDNHFALAGGEHGAFRLTKPFTRVRAAGRAPTVRRQVFLGGEATIEGLRFVMGDPVTLTDGARVVFIGCEFYLESGGGEHLVVVPATAKAVFIGCTFRGSPSAEVVDAATAATDTVFIGCRNATGATIAPAGTFTESGTI